MTPWNNAVTHDFAPMSTLLPTETGHRILLVDDHDDLLLMMSLMLRRKRGYAVETANSGQRALELAPEFCPHVIISDITMPGMNGYQMMEAMKAQDCPPFKCIALSGHDTPDGDEMESHYDVHLTKPVDFETLFSVIERLIEAEEA